MLNQASLALVAAFALVTLAACTNDPAQTCANASDCFQGESCVNGTCVVPDPGDGPDTGHSPDTTSAPDASGDTTPLPPERPTTRALLPLQSTESVGVQHMVTLPGGDLFALGIFRGTLRCGDVLSIASVADLTSAYIARIAPDGTCMGLGRISATSLKIEAVASRPGEFAVVGRYNGNFDSVDLSGGTHSDTRINDPVFIMRFNATGQNTSRFLIPNSSGLRVTDAAYQGASLLIVGHMLPGNHAISDHHTLRRLGATGRSLFLIRAGTSSIEMAWQGTTTEATDSAATAITVLPGGAFALAGTFSGELSIGPVTTSIWHAVGASNRTTGFVAAYDASGTLQWTHRIKSQLPHITDLAPLTDGGLAIAGGVRYDIDLEPDQTVSPFRSDSEYPETMFVARYAPDGTVVAYRTFESIVRAEARLAALPDGGLLVATTLPDGLEIDRERYGTRHDSRQQAFLLGLDAGLDPDWVRHITSDMTSTATALTRFTDGTLAVAGFYQGAAILHDTRSHGHQTNHPGTFIWLLTP